MSEMFPDWPILSIIAFLPAAGALLILLSRMSLRGVDTGYDNGVRLLTLIVTIATFLVSLVAFAAAPEPGALVTARVTTTTIATISGTASASTATPLERRVHRDRIRASTRLGFMDCSLVRLGDEHEDEGSG